MEKMRKCKFLSSPVLKTFFSSVPLVLRFVSIPDTFWWCLVTLTTVGYGDAVPATPLGKLVAGFSSLCGILVLAIPISLVSQNFNTQYTLLEKLKQASRKHLMMLRKVQNNPNELALCFII